jgi:ribose/xylose/arabinose/galactoside ABC-type transport system permease subunit
VEARQLRHVLPGDVALRVRGFAGSLGTLGFGLTLAFAAELIFFTIRSPYFFASDNFKNIGRAIAIIGIAAVGETIVIIAGGFDLSVGSTMAAAGMISGYLVNHGTNVWLAFLTALALGLGIGLGNGAIVSYARINPLIATLATLSIIRGLGFVITSGEDLVISNTTYLNLGTNSVGGVPITVVVLLVTFVVFGAAMPRSRFGRYAYAIGSSARASKLAGVPVSRWRLAFYATCGVLAALAGIVTVARTGTAQPSANLGIELDVITAVILGGTSLSGGRGRLAGTFLGLVLIGTLNNGLILIDVQAYWQQVVKGMILLVAVFWDELRRTRRDED